MNKISDRIEIKFQDRIFNCIKLIFPVLALILSFFAFKYSKKDGNFHRFYNLITEYQTDEFGKAITELWDFFDKNKNIVIKQIDDQDEESINNKTKNELKEDYKKNYKSTYKNGLDLKRRKVSNFYVRMYALLKHNKLTDDLLSIYWDKNNIEIIDKILIPLEEILVEILQSSKDPKIKHKKIVPLKYLYQKMNKSKKFN